MKTETFSSPALWEELPAGERTRQLLQAASLRPSDAYLLAGPDSTKSEAARLLAAAIICERACGRCETCRRVIAGLHPDVQIYEPEGYTFPVELIREIVVAAAQTPIEASRRVFILEEAHRILERSQNALLKALEEPGSRATWILTAETLEPLLPTILSRCQIIEFPPIGDDAIAKLLEARYGLGAGEAARITRSAAGDLQRAIKLARMPHQAKVRALALNAATQPEPFPRWALGTAEAVASIASEARALVEEEQRSELGNFDETLGKGRAASGARKKIVDRQKRALRRAETDVYLDFLSWLGTAYRDLAAAASGAKGTALIHEEMEEEIIEAALSRPVQFWLAMAESCSRAGLAIRDNANAGLVLEATLLRSLQTS